MRKPVPKHNRRPITLMSAIVCGLLVWAAQYLLLVRPAQVREQEAIQQSVVAQQALAANQAEEKKRQEEELKQEYAARIAVKVDSKPSGASVTVGDVHKTTPAVFPDVEPGFRTVLIHLDGYQDYKQNIKAEANKPLDLGVIPLVQLTGNLSMTSPQSGVTYVLTGPNGEMHQGALPDKIADLPVGAYQLVAKQHDWTLPPMTVNLHSQENLQETVKFPYATLALDSAPSGATVRNGHTILGRTPLTLNDLHPGTMHLSFDLPPYTLQRFDIDLPDFGNVNKHGRSR